MLLRRLGWPLGPLPLLGVVVASGALTGVANRPGDDYGLWVTTSAAVHESVGVVAIVVAFAAAWAGRELSRRDVIFHGAGVGSRGRQLVSLVAILSTSALLGVALGLVPLLLWTARTATWGGFDPLGLAMAVAGVVLVVVVAVTLGALSERLAWSFVIAGGLAAALWLPSTLDRAFAVVSPVWDWDSGARFGANPAPIGYFIAFAAVVAATSAVVFVTRGQNGSRLALAGLGLVAGGLFVLPLVWRPDLYVLRDAAAPQCDVVAGTEVCVHPANATALERVEAGVAGVNELLGEQSVARVVDLNASDTVAAAPGELLTTIGPGYATPEVQVDLVYRVAGTFACDELFPVVEDGVPPDEYLTSLATAATLFTRLELDDLAFEQRNRTQVGAPFDAFDAMSDERLQQFVRDNREALSTCSATLGGAA